MSVVDELRRVAELHTAGHLTDEEFEAAKGHILGGSASVPESPSATSGPQGVRQPAGAESRWQTLSAGARLSLAASGAVVIAVAAGIGVVVFTDGEKPSGSQARPLPAAEEATPSVAEESPSEVAVPAEEPTEEVYADSVTVEDSGWTRMIGGSVASWGAVLDNPTSTFTSLTVSVEQLDREGAIVNSDTVDVTVEPNTKAPVGGIVPLELDTNDVNISVTLNSYDEEDGEFFIVNDFSLDGKIGGTETNSEVTVTASSALQIGEFCTMYLAFRNGAGNLVGGAAVEDHPPIPAGGEKTFKKYLTDNLLVPADTDRVSGYADTSSCF